MLQSGKCLGPASGQREQGVGGVCSQRWGQGMLGNADRALMASLVNSMGASTFSPEGIPFGTCLWSWFMWNCGPPGLGGAAGGPLPALLYFTDGKPEVQRGAAIYLGHTTARQGLGGKGWEARAGSRTAL